MIIKIKNLRIKTIIGIYDWEQNFEREIIINANIFTNYNNSLVTDEIEDTIDYDKIVSDIKTLTKEKKFKLIEKLAQEVMNLIMRNKKVKKCQLEIDKVGAVEGLESFAILIEEEK